MGCGNPKLTEEAPGPEASPLPIELTQVNLPILHVEPSFSHDAEFRGLVTAAIELGLSDIPGVLPVLPGDVGAPSLTLDRRVAPRQVDATFVARGKPEALTLELELCVPGGSCDAWSAPATSKTPWEAIGTLLEGAAGTLAPEPVGEADPGAQAGGGPASTVPDATRIAWHRPGSKDSYAEFITGRAFAQLYGILPPTMEPGDRRNDPVLRAIFLDPGQPLAQWARARWEMASTVDGGKAAEALSKAELARPDSPLLVADRATLLGLSGHPLESLLAWEALAAAHPGDPRWLEPLARAYLAANRPKDALEVLARLPEASAWDARVAELRVRATESSGAEGLDPLLERWQSVASSAAEPVRRRIALRVATGDYEAAESLAPVLRQRASGPATDALEVALLMALGRHEDAAALAPADIAERIRAQLARAENPGAAGVNPGAGAYEAAMTEGEGALWRKDNAAAAAAADAALSAMPHSSAAWALRARAMEAAGHPAEAAEAWERAWELDPGLTGGPVESGRIASTFRYVEAGEHPELATEGEVGPKGPEL